MLQAMRQMVRSWVAKALIALLVLSFAAWGIGDIFLSRSEGVVATVGDREIDSYTFANAFHARLEEFAQGGQELDVSEAIRLGVDEVVLDEIGRRLALDNAAAELGLDAPDSAVSEAITTRPAFQDAAGRFDPERYARLLSINGLSQKEFEASVRHDVARTALVQAIASGAALPKALAEPLYGRIGERRVLSYLRLEADADEPLPPPTEGEIADYLAANEDRFRNPAEADMVFLWVSPHQLAEPEQVPEEEARATYDLDIDLYTTPATRELRQIVFETEAEADAARSRLEAGTTLLEIGGEMGLDADSIELGVVQSGELAPDVATAVFAATAPGPVGPVRTAFGWSILEVLTVTEANTVSWEEARDDILRDIAVDAALDDIPDLLARAEDRLAAGDSLEEIGPALGLPPQVFTMDTNGRLVDLKQNVQFPPDRELVDLTFEMQPGDEPEILYLDSGGAVVLRVDARRESAVPPLAELRDEIVELLESESRAARALAEAEQARERLAAGESLDSIAGALELTVQVTEPLQRYARAELPPDLIDRAFALAAGDSLAGAGPGEEAFLLRADEILPEDQETVDRRLEQLLPALQAAVDEELFQAFSREVVSDYPLLVNRTGVEAALGLLSDS